MLRRNADTAHHFWGNGRTELSVVDVFVHHILYTAAVYELGDADSSKGSSSFFVISFWLAAHVQTATKPKLHNRLAPKPAEGKQQMHQVRKLLTVQLEFVD